MNLILFGTDDCLQHSDACLKERIAALSESRQVTFIGEEYTPNSVAHQVADSKGIRWIPIDMCEKERSDAGIGDLSERRLRYRVNKGIPEETPIYAPKEDGIREYFWLARIEKEQREGTALVICGAVHVRPLSVKAEHRGHQVTRLFFPESLSEFWVSIMPELMLCVSSDTAVI